jgi:hypothetical protein
MGKMNDKSLVRLTVYTYGKRFVNSTRLEFKFNSAIDAHFLFREIVLARIDNHTVRTRVKGPRTPNRPIGRSK